MKNFNKQNGMSEQKSRVMMKKTRAKGWVTVGLTALAFLGMASVSNDNATVEAATAKGNVANVNYLKGYGVNLWKDAPAVSFANQHLATGSNWKTFSAVKGNNNSIFYTLGTNQLADSKYLDLAHEDSKQALKGIIKVNYVKGFGINLWDSPLSTRKAIAGRKLADGSRWKTTSRQVVDGKTWYEVGTNQWVEGDFADLVQEDFRGEKTFLNGSPLTENGTTTPEGNTNNNNNGGNTVKPDENNGNNGNGGNTNTDKPVNPDENNGNTGNNGNGGNTDTDKPVNPDENNGGTTTPDSKKFTITVKFLDEKGQEFVEDSVFELKEGETFDFEALKFLGYKLTDKQSHYNFKVTADKTIVLHYAFQDDTAKPVEQGTVNVKYVDRKDGKEIATTKTLTGEVGKEFTAEQLEIDGYTFKSVKGNAKGTFTKASQTVTFEYAKTVDMGDLVPSTPIDKGMVSVKYVDRKTGAEIATPKVLSGNVGDSFTAEKLDIKGYTFKSVKGNAQGTFTKGSQSVVFEYAKTVDMGDLTPAIKHADITIQLVDESGNVVATDKLAHQEVGKTVSVKAPTVPEGFELVGNAEKSVKVKDQDNVVVFNVKEKAPEVKFADLKVRVIDENGTVLKETTSSKKVGEQVSVSAPTVEGYDIVGATTQTITIKDTTNLVTFTAKKQEVSQTLDTQLIANKVIALVNQWRVQNGLHELTTESHLVAGSQVRAEQEAQAVIDANMNLDAADHKTPDGGRFNTEANLSQYPSSYMSENLAISYGDTEDDIANRMFNQWKKSAGHNKNMLDSKMYEIGVGIVLLPDGYIVGIQDFGGHKATNDNWVTENGITSQDITGKVSDEELIQSALENADVNIKEGNGNYFISKKHFFKTRADVEAWVQNNEDTQSFWYEAEGNFRYISVEVNGMSGWILALTNMEKPAQDYINDGYYD